MVITTINDFKDETAWEGTILDYAIPLMPLTASGATLDARTKNIAITAGSSIGGDSGEEMRNRLLPLLFGAAWKIIDIAFELAFAQAGLAPQRGGRWTISEKSQRAAAHSGSLPGLTNSTDVWNALSILYAETVEIRHALVHRRVQVDPSTRTLTGFDTSGNALLPLSYDEQMAFCRIAYRVSQAITEGTLRPRVEADLLMQLADVQRHHGQNVASGVSGRAPVRVIDDLPASGRVDVPHLLAQAQTTFPGAQYVDLELRLADGRTLTGELESAPQSILTVDPSNPPDWLKFI